MDQVIIVRYGEISLKGRNRGFFEDKLVDNLRLRLQEYPNLSFYKRDSRIYIELNGTPAEPVLTKAAVVFGVVSLSLATRCSTRFEEITAVAVAETENALKREKIKTFKAQAKRGDKKYPLDSQEIGREIGACILRHFDGQLTVDVHHPDLTVYVEVRDYAYVYSQKVPGYGGLPYGTSGKGLLLLSGGIDSPVAGWMMAKRGLMLEAIHFHSYPFTSERAKEKVEELARILSLYCRRIKLYHINLLEIQTAIREKCPEELFTILSRRFMMFIAARVAAHNHCEALITGENISQVASQTLQSLHVTNAAVDIPVFRPLIAMDKMDIINIAEKIGTYETSILPYEDCCTVFLPKNPATKPRLDKVLTYESALDKEALIKNALDGLECKTITP
ncbi:MAG TPA: tRNA uracil 4-sulfurtransferase ThiI [Bacillota bacterium]|nr:tRNA uracil 4-sulfurtransferase ThiI [Bacillota bacterium]HPT86847.1 tRNA uracil 4-sulfurtransferase ThiI [Bacillota bacterium]